jgi:protein-tyrosine phosphatase
LTSRDADHLIADLGVQSVIDLRSTAELHRFGPSLLVGRDIPMFHIPIVDASRPVWADDDQKLAGVYAAMLDEAGPRFAAVIEVLADIDGTTTFHGAAGKDRTGLVAAIVLSVLGASDCTIGNDYGISAFAVPTMVERYDNRSGWSPWQSADETPMPESLVREMMSARPATINSVMLVLRVEHGSVENWLVHNGLDPAACSQLRDRLLVSPSAPTAQSSRRAHPSSSFR